MVRINLPLTANEVGLITTKEPALDIVTADDPTAARIVVAKDGGFAFDVFVREADQSTTRLDAVEIKDFAVDNETEMLGLVFGHGPGQIFTGDEVWRVDAEAFFKFEGFDQADVADITKWQNLSSIDVTAVGEEGAIQVADGFGDLLDGGATLDNGVMTTTELSVGSSAFNPMTLVGFGNVGFPEIPTQDTQVAPGMIWQEMDYVKWSVGVQVHVRTHDVNATYGRQDGTDFDNAYNGIQNVPQVPPFSTVIIHGDHTTNDPDPPVAWKPVFWNTGVFVRPPDTQATRSVVDHIYRWTDFEKYSGITIYGIDFWFDFRGYEYSPGGGSPVPVPVEERTQDCRILQCRFTGGNYGIQLNLGNDGWVIENNDIYNVRHGAIYGANNGEAGSANNVRVAFNYIHDINETDEQFDGHAVGMQGCSNWYVGYNYCTRCGGSAIEAYAGNNKIQRDNVFEHNTIDGARNVRTLGRGIALTADNANQTIGFRTGNIIRDNWISNTEGEAISLNVLGDDPVVCENNDLNQPLTAGLSCILSFQYGSVQQNPVNNRLYDRQDGNFIDADLRYGPLASLTGTLDASNLPALTTPMPDPPNLDLRPIVEDLEFGYFFDQEFTDEPFATYRALDAVGQQTGNTDKDLVLQQSGDTCSHVPGVIGNAVRMPTGSNIMRWAVDDSVPFNFDGTQDFSYNFWIYLRNDRGTILGRGSWASTPSDVNHVVRVNGNSLVFNRSTDGTAQTGGPSQSGLLNQWANYHVDYRASDRRMRMIRNGDLDNASVVIAQPGAWHISTNTPWSIGRWRNADFLDADLDMLYAWTRQLTDTEITRLYNNGSGLRSNDILQAASGVNTFRGDIDVAGEIREQGERVYSPNNPPPGGAISAPLILQGATATDPIYVAQSTDDDATNPAYQILNAAGTSVFSITGVQGGTRGVFKWENGSELLEDTGTARMVYKPYGSRFHVLNQAGTNFDSEMQIGRVYTNAINPAAVAFGDFVDRGTGMYFPSTGQVAVATAGVQAYRINDSQQMITKVVVQATELVKEPTGTSETIQLDDGNHHVLKLGSAAGDVTLTLDPPAFTSAGRILIRQGDPVVDLTFAPGGGAGIRTINLPDFLSDVTNSLRACSWTFDADANEIVLLFSDLAA